MHWANRKKKETIVFSESELKLLENSAQIFNALSDIPGDIDDVDQLFQVSLELGGSLSDVLIETHRRRHLAYLMADQGGLVGNPDASPNLPKQHLNRRHMKRNKSVLQTFLFGSDDSEEDAKSKNIRQTGNKLKIIPEKSTFPRIFFSFFDKISEKRRK